jgi:hypothetical protein
MSTLLVISISNLYGKLWVCGLIHGGFGHQIKHIWFIGLIGLSISSRGDFLNVLKC